MGRLIMKQYTAYPPIIPGGGERGEISEERKKQIEEICRVIEPASKAWDRCMWKYFESFGFGVDMSKAVIKKEV